MDTARATNLPTIEGVVLDLDGTLYRQGPVQRAMAARLLAHVVRHPIDGWRVAMFIRAYRQAQERLRSEGAGTDQLSAACRQAATDRAWGARAVAEWMEERPLDLVRRHMRRDGIKFLESARRRGIRLAVLSDYPAEAKLLAMGIRPFFDVVRCAQDSDIGVFKPDPSGLRRTLEALGVPPGRALYVGDRADVDGEAARAAGVCAAILTTSSRMPAGEGRLSVAGFGALGEALGWS